MKTSELMKIVEENGCNFMNSGDYYKIDGGAYIFAKVNKGNSEFLILHKLPKDIAQAVLEYAYTPLEEREEEKKYLLMFPKGYTKYGKSALTLNIHDNFYFNGGFDAEKTELSNYKKKFTQKEIDEMPFDTKFFEKVLVE